MKALQLLLIPRISDHLRTREKLEQATKPQPICGQRHKWQEWRGRRSMRVRHVPLICNVWTASSIGLNTSSDRFEQHLQFVWTAFTITIGTSLHLANSRLAYLASVSVRHGMTRIYAQRKHNHWFVCPIHLFVVNDNHNRNCHQQDLRSADSM